ncbi:MAG: hypothetical protein CL406_07745 [Acidimicrobiaceae bacterium]|nr:hypothetical protein [Acidimicrobiaceae bacterium]MDP6481829.1 hypothetical protein [Acidimicrobiales bacterium]MDP6697680.1 hypothetical protein [Acidimicrobiales bacterium]
MKVPGVILAAVVLVASACAEVAVTDDPVVATPPTLSTTTTTTSRPNAPASTHATVVETVPVVTAVEEEERFTDLPEASAEFCADLATETGQLTVQIEGLLADGPGNEARNLHALLSVSADLLVWTARNAPLGMAVDVGLLRSVYSDVGTVLDRLDPDSVTLDELRGELFTVMFESPMANAEALDRSAQRLSAFVRQSCGTGYPLMDTFADLFSTGR